MKPLDLIYPSDAHRIAAAAAFLGVKRSAIKAGGAGDVTTPAGDRWVKTLAEIADRCNDRDELADAVKHYDLFIDDARVAWLISSI